MITNKLKELERSIKKGEWNPKYDNELWGGADVIVAYRRTKELTEWELDDELIINGNGLKHKSRVIILSKHANQISSLFHELKDIFKDHIDFANKYNFYRRIGEEAKSYIEKKDDKGVLLAIVEEAKKMAAELDERLYFAYGSNMDEEQMAKRCPDAKLIKKARLDGYKFIINSRGVASIIKQSGSYVEGLLWEISFNDEASLDRYEGADSGIYSKDEAVVNGDESEGKNKVLVYIAADDSHGYPRPGYLEKIIKAAEKFKFDSDYLIELKRWFD